MDNMYQWPDYIGITGSIMVNDKPVEVRVQLFDEEAEARIFIASDRFGDEYHPMAIPETVNISDPIYGAARIKLGDYTISEVFIKCNEWNIILPKTVEWVAVHKDLNPNGFFSVDENNPYLFSEHGSLYSKNGELVYLCIPRNIDYGETIVLRDDIRKILPYAIRAPKRLSLVIPEECTELAKEAIVGSYDRIDFKGGLCVIETDALKGIGCDDLRINGLLSDINTEGQMELYTWYKNRDIKRVKRLFLAAPMAKDSEALENGYIKLTRVLPIQEKLERTLVESMDKDSSPVYINSYINERFTTTDSISMPIVIDTIPLYDGNYSGWNYYFYKPIEVTRIKFVEIYEDKNRESNYFEVLVHEPVERVLELIHESFNSQLKKNN
jgi:hypothetical protein